MGYELYYWPEIQGRGEFVRLALAEAGADYVDVARKPGGEAKLMKLLDGARMKHPPFAPPFLKAGAKIIGQTPNILMFLGAHHRLAPREETGRLFVNQLQLTIADFLVEVHDVHHPIASSLYYEDQKNEAKRRAGIFLNERVPKFMGYFERVIAKSRGPYLLGRKLTYADLSLFQIVAGLRYAFPKAMRRMEKKMPRVVAVHNRVMQRPRIRDYLRSDARIAFNTMGIFRYYPELDA